MEPIRINKYLSQCGYCSRREADRLLDEGKVYINGEVAMLGAKVTPEDEISVEGQLITNNEKEVIIAYNKPIGVVCTTSKKDKNNIIDAINYPTRIYPVGRLDKDSTGLILLTNNGQLMDDILRARNNHEKEYIVTVDKRLKREIIDAMCQGVPILDTITKPCNIDVVDERTFKIILTQGLNRQIRRMCEYFGYRVKSLKRIRIMNIELNDLEVGSYRYLSSDEKNKLFELVEK